MSKIAASVYHTLRTYKYTRKCAHATEFAAILAGCFSVFVGWWERMSQTLFYSECHKPCSKLLDAFQYIRIVYNYVVVVCSFVFLGLRMVFRQKFTRIVFISLVGLNAIGYYVLFTNTIGLVYLSSASNLGHFIDNVTCYTKQQDLTTNVYRMVAW